MSNDHLAGSEFLDELERNVQKRRHLVNPFGSKRVIDFLCSGDETAGGPEPPRGEQRHSTGAPMDDTATADTHPQENDEVNGTLDKLLFRSRKIR